MTRSACVRAVAAAWLAVSSFSFAVAQRPDPGTAPAAPRLAGRLVQDKIDPALLRDALQLEERGFVLERGIARQHVRVVVDVRRAPGDPTFETATARDRVAQVAAGVRHRQEAFLRAVDATMRPDLRREIEFVDRLTLQYSVVALVRSSRALADLALRDDVKYLWKDALNRLLTNEGRALTRSDAAAAAGWRGTGIGVAVIDTKFDLLHPELGGSTNLPNGVVYAGQNFSNPGTSIHSRTFNDCYHGTGTASIVRRYAPGVSLYCLTVFPNAYNSVIANAINWCVTNRNGVAGGAPIKVISMSLGGGRYTSAQTSGTLHSACSTALSNGILCFAAAGNDGWTNAMGSPAASTAVVSVGSVWDTNGAPYSPFPPAYCSDSNRQVDERACYSDTASFLDVYAPSEQVICARCGGGTFALGGTSSACPAAAGMAAQLLQAAPQLAGNRSGVISLLQSTGAAVIGDSGKRRIDIKAAIDSARGGGGGGGTPELKNGVQQNYSVATGAIKRWTIAIPSGASNLVVAITGTGDADLYVKNAPISWPGDKGRHDTSTFKSPYIGGSNESVTFASPGAGTWHVLVHGYSGNPAGTIKATWDTGGGGGGNKSWHGVSWVRETPHNYANNKTYSYTYSKPGADFVAVHFDRLDTEANYDFLRVKDAAGNVVYQESGNRISGGSGSAFGRTDGWAVVQGSSITIELVTDYSVTRWGFRTDVAAAYY